MRKRLLLPLLIILSLLRAGHALAGVEQLSESEFRELAKVIAPKVNLFRDVWAADPKAEFYGGTSRDYLYWLKGKFREARTKEEAQKIAEGLRRRGTIDIREFIIGGSDVDIISHSGFSVDPARYGVRKIDSHGADYFHPGTETWKNELNQGHIPAEKIRLSANGTIPVPELGDGVKEIYSGKLSIQFADPKVFAQTKYAKEKLNHPILLALRYLRLQAMNYFQEHGAGLPDKHLLFSGMDETSRAAVKKVISESTASRELKPYLKQDRFKSWLNGTIQKSFLSYTNQTAALELMREFGVDDLHAAYPSVEPINQYVFQQYRDEKAIEASLKKYGVDKEKFYQPPSRFFPDGNLYHGTKTEPAFRSIIFQGALNSEDGTAGKGLYGVSEGYKQFSEDWGGSKERLLRLPVESDATIVDVKSGEGRRIFRKFGGDFEAFAQAFGVDIIRYEYGETDAYVVKNGAALGHAQGVYRELLHFDQLMERLAQSKTAEERVNLLKLNALSQEDMEIVHQKFPKLSGEVVEWLVSRKNPSAEAATDHAAILSFAKKEVYRLAQTNDPATLDRLAKAVRPLSMDVLKSILDAPEPLFHRFVSELATDITGEYHPIFYQGFDALFSDPQSVRLAPILDKYLQYGDHSRRHSFTQMFSYPHMAQLEKQMLSMMKKNEPNIHDALAKQIFNRPVALKYPNAFETWLKSSEVSGNHGFYVRDLLEAPYLKESDAYLKLVVENLTALYPDSLAQFLRSLPADKRQALLPLAMEKLPQSNHAYFLKRMFMRQGQEAFASIENLTPWEKKFVWDAWQKAPMNLQSGFAPLVMPQIEDLPVGQRSEAYRRLLAGASPRDDELNIIHHFFHTPPAERPPELWDALRPRIEQKEYTDRLWRYANFTPGLPERKILDAIIEADLPMAWENLKGLALPRDQEALLKLLQHPWAKGNDPLLAEIVKGALSSPEASGAEETALAILQRAGSLEELEMDRLLLMDHAKDWHRARLLYLERAYDWHPNQNQLAAADTPEGRAKIRAVITERKSGWQKKIYLSRHFPESGGAVGMIRGFFMDCAAGFAKLK